MKCDMFKFNPDRKPEYQVQTEIIERNGKKFVIKRPSNKESEKHVQEIFDNYFLLKPAYSDVEVCSVKKNENFLEFEFVNGKQMTQLYIDQKEKQNKKDFLKLVDIHRKLLLGNEDNMCVFTETQQFEDIFGNGRIFDGKPALKVSNFEGTAQNIIFRIENNKPVFIDYEWVFDFPIPVDLLLYHCIISLYIFFIPGLDAFITKRELCKYLNITTDIDVLDEFWGKFPAMIDGEEEQKLSTIKRTSYLKEQKDIDQLALENARLSGLNLYNKELEKNLKQQQDCIDELSKGIEGQNQYVASLERNIENQKIYIDTLEKNAKDKTKYVKALEKATSEQHQYITALETNIKDQQNYIEELNKSITDFSLKNEKLAKDLREKISKVNEQKTLINRQQHRLFEQAEFIDKVKSSLLGRILLANDWRNL